MAKMIDYKVFDQDGDGHWYLIPIEEHEDFRIADDTADDETIIDKYSKYRIDDPVLIPVVTMHDMGKYLEKLSSRLDEIVDGGSVDLNIYTLEYDY